MNKKEFFELIAKQVREFCEKYQEKHELWNNKLQGMCAIASYLIFDILKENDYNPSFVHAEINPCAGHCFILCEGYLIDVTATQFNIDKKVVVEEYDKVEQTDFWRRNTFITSEEGIKRLVNGWGTEQDPFLLDVGSAFINFEETFEYASV